MMWPHLGQGRLATVKEDDYHKEGQRSSMVAVLNYVWGTVFGIQYFVFCKI